MLKLYQAFGAFALGAGVMLPGAEADSARGAPFLQTNEMEMERLATAPSLDIGDPEAVFGAVFAALDDEIRVWPSENYYFFRFLHGGIVHDGNLRLDAADRDEGIIHLAYFARDSVDGDPGPYRHRAFTMADGVKVTRAEAHTYVVIHAGKAVVFRLNDLSGVVPPDNQLGGEDRLIGPILDESGIGFFLIWNRELSTFYYILNEDMVRDEFSQVQFSGQVEIGRRTGFALYRDRYHHRRILVGVRREQAQRNTWFDGPFDQMPDNFIVGESLREALVSRRPELEGRIDRRGNLEGLAGRVIIVPYLEYSEPGDLAVLDQCAARAASRAAYYRCFDRGAAAGKMGVGLEEAGADSRSGDDAPGQR